MNIYVLIALLECHLIRAERCVKKGCYSSSFQRRNHSSNRLVNQTLITKKQQAAGDKVDEGHHRPIRHARQTGRKAGLYKTAFKQRSLWRHICYGRTLTAKIQSSDLNHLICKKIQIHENIITFCQG